MSAANAGPANAAGRIFAKTSAHSLNHNIPEALATLAAIGPAAEKLVTHRLPLAGIAEVFAGHKLAGSMKVHMVL